MRSLFPNKNLNVLVTGGSRGIGRAICVRLAATCARSIIVNYLENDQAANETRALVEEQDCSCVLARANLAYPDEIDKLFQTVTSSVEHLNVLVHCAALNTFKPLINVKPNQWDLTHNINSRSFLLLVQKAVPLMPEGRIVAISSLGSHRVIPNYGALGPAKAALESIIRYLAVELAPRRILVNGVAGGLVETDSLKQFPEAQKLIDEVSRLTPAKRLGTAEEIADVTLFLVSPLSRWVYGQIIVADGGLSLL